ncbi:MAG: 5-formyltetrahydrofolate cyclo-ligase [Oceanicoccus sp.]
MQNSSDFKTSMKEEIRERTKAKRLAIKEMDRERKSHRIYEKLMSLSEFKEAKNIMIYISSTEEVVTHFMVKRLLQMDKTLYVPKVVDQTLIACRLDHWEDLDFGSFGILEPNEVIEIKHPSEIDVIIAPGVAFTKEGARLGMGKGFYDRFMRNYTGLKIGLAYEEQIIEEIPTEDHDVQMDMIITNENIYRP